MIKEPEVPEIAEYYIIVHNKKGYYVGGIGSGCGHSNNPLYALKFSKPRALSYIRDYLYYCKDELTVKRVCYCVD